jgi:membrane associated rhomboid family serine protease
MSLWGSSRRSVPVATLVVVALTGVVSIVGLLQPQVLAGLERNSAELRAGHWWRLITPLLVQSDGWGQLALNLVGTAVFGALVEWAAGPPVFLVTYLSGGLVGQALAYSWETGGAGSSVAMVGVLGALSVLLSWPDRERSQRERLAAGAGLCLMLALVGLHFGPNPYLTEALLVAAGSAFVAWQIRMPRAAPAHRLLSGLVLLSAVVLTLLRDHRGPALLAGALVAAPMLRWRRPASGP